jgi:hypothetical protein
LRLPRTPESEVCDKHLWVKSLANVSS